MVDDEPSWLDSFQVTLDSAGIDNVMVCRDSREVMDILSCNEIGVLLLDLHMPHLTGLDLLPMVTRD
jgi:FixJ family two-component response regulator